ncbi:DUF427 domain-containing protein [Streptomyces mirabilis]|uniref:DUF427 domain-containing protein n=1 Tax=Streptomyces mirabilis TaxID=68239 RepID=UPI00363BD996
MREVQPTPRADCEDVVLLHEPGRYPVAYFPLSSLRSGVLEASGRTTQHRELGETSWFTVGVGGRRTERAYDRLTPACAGRTTAPREAGAAGPAHPACAGMVLVGLGLVLQSRGLECRATRGRRRVCSYRRRPRVFEW